MSQTSRLSSKSLSPMDVSGHGVMGSSGIEGVGTMFPDFSPIKDDEMGGGVTQNAIQEQAMETGGTTLVQLIFILWIVVVLQYSEHKLIHVRPRPDLVPVPGHCALALKDKPYASIIAIVSSTVSQPQLQITGKHG